MHAKIKQLAGALALAGFATVSHANPEIDALRAEIAQMKRQYEARLAELEARLRAAEGRATSTTPASDRLGAVTAGSAFNPQISVILDGVYYRDKGKGPELYEHIAGINHSHGEHKHGIERGFNLRPTELIFSATVDPWFDANLMLTVDSEGGVALEQAYFDTRSLPAGLKLRGGKFFSGIGYLNDKHPHQWDFVDQNLPYRTLLGEHGLVDTGLQLTWRPKTGSLYTLLGVEALQGNEQVFATAGLEKPYATWSGDLARKKAGPRLWTGFAKFAPSLANNHALQLGVWGAWASQHQEVHDEDEYALEGKSRLWGLDAVYKYDAPGAYGAGDFSLSAEYLREVKDLKVASSDNVTELGEPRKFTQDGFYIQGVYGFAPRWQVGLRYDVTGLTNKLEKGSDVERWDDSRRWSLALTHHFSEFSRLRLQLGRASLYTDEDKRERVNEIWLQYQHSLGAHGAHKF